MPGRGVPAAASDSPGVAREKLRKAQRIYSTMYLLIVVAFLMALVILYDRFSTRCSGWISSPGMIAMRCVRSWRRHIHDTQLISHQPERIAINLSVVKVRYPAGVGTALYFDLLLFGASRDEQVIASMGSLGMSDILNVPSLPFVEKDSFIHRVCLDAFFHLISIAIVAGRLTPDWEASATP
jgi:hypothetical protein